MRHAWSRARLRSVLRFWRSTPPRCACPIAPVAQPGRMLFGLALSALFLAAIIRFRPGAIDHHNVQLILATFIAAMLLDPRARAASFAAAAIAGALALAIGAETTPMLAVSAIVVALLWTIYGERYRNAAIGFGLTFALATAVVLLGTTPIRMISAVTCDTLSMGYFSLVVAGGVTLALSAMFVSQSSPAIRLAALAFVGVVTLGVALVVAPQCLHNPLSDLDPLLQTLWLSSVTEAQSIVAEMAVNPETIGGFYAVGLIAMAVCALRIVRSEDGLPHAVLFALIAISWAVTALQIRGMIFANFLAFIPLSALISDLRDLYKAHQKDARAAFAFVMSVLVKRADRLDRRRGPSPSKPAMRWRASPRRTVRSRRQKPGPAWRGAAWQQLTAAMETGARHSPSTSNPGSAPLRFTPHSVLTANHHRNQAGMVGGPQGCRWRHPPTPVRYWPSRIFAMC